MTWCNAPARPNTIASRDKSSRTAHPAGDTSGHSCRSDAAALVDVKALRPVKCVSNMGRNEATARDRAASRASGEGGSAARILLLAALAPLFLAFAAGPAPSLRFRRRASMAARRVSRRVPIASANSAEAAANAFERKAGAFASAPEGKTMWTIAGSSGHTA